MSANKLFFRKSYVRALILSICILLFLLITISLRWRLQGSSNVSVEEEVIDELVVCIKNSPKLLYPCMSNVFGKYADRLHIDKLAVKIVERAKADANLSSSCHTAAHALGHKIFASTPDPVMALQKCNSFCSDGCAMGVMEKFLGIEKENHKTMKEILQKADRVCMDHSNMNPPLLVQCYHGLGHVILRLSSDLTEANSFCDQFSRPEKIGCLYGAAMEVANGQESMQNAKNLDSPDDLCLQYKHGSSYEFACSVHLPVLWHRWGITRPKILSLCLSTHASNEGCIKGIAQLETDVYLQGSDRYMESLVEELQPKLRETFVQFVVQTVQFKSSSMSINFCKSINDTLLQEKCYIYLTEAKQKQEE